MKNKIENIFCYSAAIGFILDQADKMKESKIYFHNEKKWGNKFLQEIAKHENTFADFVDADVMVESYQVFENILSVSLTIDPKKKKSFNREIEEAIKKYHGQSKK